MSDGKPRQEKLHCVLLHSHEILELGSSLAVKSTYLPCIKPWNFILQKDYLLYVFDCFICRHVTELCVCSIRGVQKRISDLLGMELQRPVNQDSVDSENQTQVLCKNNPVTALNT